MFVFDPGPVFSGIFVVLVALVDKRPVDGGSCSRRRKNTVAENMRLGALLAGTSCVDCRVRGAGEGDGASSCDALSLADQYRSCRCGVFVVPSIWHVCRWFS